MSTNPTQTLPKRIFVDTQGWAEVFHPPAIHHAQAETILTQSRTLNWKLITTNFVLSELVPLFRSRLFHLQQSQGLSIIAKIRALPNLTVIAVDDQDDQKAWDLLYANQQHPWSHVDATSMVVMRRLGLNEILTADKHFTQAGFMVLL